MKKTSAIILIASLLTAACSKPIETRTFQNLPEAPYEKFARSFKAAGENEFGLVSLNLSEGGIYILTTKKGEEIIRKTGTYKTNSEHINLIGYGHAYFTQESKSQTGKIYLEIIPENTSEDNKAFTVECSVDYPETREELFRTWNIKGTRINLTGNTSINADFDGADLDKIKTFLANNGILLNEIPDGMAIEYIDISGLGDILVQYKNGKTGYATWSGNPKSNLKLEWKDEELKYRIFGTTASLSFSGEYCIMSMTSMYESQGKTSAVRVILTLEQKKQQ